MMVPRSFVPLQTAKRRSMALSEKEALRTRSRLSDDAAAFEAGTSPSSGKSPLEIVVSTSGNTRSDPVSIPTQRKKRPTALPSTPSPVTSSAQLSVPTVGIVAGPRRISSAQDLLTATTIPRRKRPLKRRLPAGDHVADFSRLIMDDVKPGGDGNLSGSLGNPHFDGLFGNIDELVEGQMFVGSEGVDASVLSTRSASTESMPSLGSLDDFSAGDLTGFSSPQRNVVDKRLRQIASSEGCDNDHPLLPLQEPESHNSSPPEIITPRNLSPTRRPLHTRDRPSAFKSSLSASLRALKSAAQSVSSITSSPPIITPDEFLHHSFFKIQPGLTDDKRPPPSSDLPSPELRRYLNPNRPPSSPDSPAQLHFWQEERPTRVTSSPKTLIHKSKRNTTQSPSPPQNIPLQSCLPSTIRTANASAPPIWISADGTPSNKRTVGHNLSRTISDPGIVKQREPRENPDFLRVLVAEMNMRRAGKFKADAAGRARLWVDARASDPKEKRRRAEERFVVWLADDDGNRHLTINTPPQART